MNSQSICCTTCMLEMQFKKMGVNVIELASFGPYKIWCADLYECPQCHCHIIKGFAEEPFAEHFESNFAAVLKDVMTQPVFFIKEKP